MRTRNIILFTFDQTQSYEYFVTRIKIDFIEYSCKKTLSHTAPR